MRNRRMVVVWALVAAAACAPPGRPAAGPPLAGSLEVAVAPDTVWLALHATNVSGVPVRLRFASAQQVEFEVRRAGGGEVWRWSAGQLFAQVLTEEELPAGATRQWRAAWPAGGVTGSYVAVGRLLAADRPLVLETGFEVVRE